MRTVSQHLQTRFYHSVLSLEQAAVFFFLILAAPWFLRQGCCSHRRCGQPQLVLLLVGELLFFVFFFFFLFFFLNFPPPCEAILVVHATSSNDQEQAQHRQSLLLLRHFRTGHLLFSRMRSRGGAGVRGGVWGCFLVSSCWYCSSSHTSRRTGRWLLLPLQLALPGLCIYKLVLRNLNC